MFLCVSFSLLFAVFSAEDAQVVNITVYYMTLTLDDKIYTGGDLENDCSTLSFGNTLRACPTDPPTRLVDGITLEGQPFDSDQFIGWGDDVLLIFEFPLTSITRVDIYFYNNPSEGIGLPPLQTITARYTDGSLDLDNGEPVGIAFSDNSHLTQQDDTVISVSIAVDSFIDGDPNNGIQYTRLRLIFDTTNTNINTTYISEVELFSVSGGGAPVFSPIQFITPMDQSMVYGSSINSTTLVPSSVDLVCTVSNNGSFTYTWTGPDGTEIMNNNKKSIYSADTTRTSILRISQLSITDNGTYSCEVTYDHVRVPFELDPVPTASTAVTLQLQGSVSAPGTVLTAIGDESVDLSCVFTGYFPSIYTIIWRNNDGEVLENFTDGYNITTSLEGPGQANIGGQLIFTGITSTLTINGVVESDIGMQYTCEMEGTNIREIIQLYERTAPPTTTSTIAMVSMSSTTLRFSTGSSSFASLATPTISTTNTPPTSTGSSSSNSIVITTIGVAVSVVVILVIVMVIVLSLIIYWSRRNVNKIKNDMNKIHRSLPDEMESEIHLKPNVIYSGSSVISVGGVAQCMDTQLTMRDTRRVLSPQPSTIEPVYEDLDRLDEYENLPQDYENMQLPN